MEDEVKQNLKYYNDLFDDIIDTRVPAKQFIKKGLTRFFDAQTSHPGYFIKYIDANSGKQLLQDVNFWPDSGTWELTCGEVINDRCEWQPMIRGKGWDELLKTLKDKNLIK